MVNEMVSLGIGGLVAVLLLTTGHWCPLIRGLSRLWAYVYGVASLWVGFALWRLLNGDWRTPAGLLVIAAVGGGIVVAAYRIDGWALAIRQARRAEEMDDELAKPRMGGGQAG
jgi:hypothetical protein